jgi:hypothetical protein
MLIGIQWWVPNSVEGYTDDTDSFITTRDSIINYAGVTLAAFFLMYSMIIHRLQFTSIRIICDLCSIGTLLSAIFNLISIMSSKTQYNAAIYTDLLQCIFSALVQFCDAFVFYYCYKLIHKSSTLLFKTLWILYVAIVLLASWLLFYTFFPFFFNINSKYGGTIFSYAPLCYSWGTVLHNFYFSWYFFLAIYKRFRNDSHTTIPLVSQIFCVKCLAHCATR